MRAVWWFGSLGSLSRDDDWGKSRGSTEVDLLAVVVRKLSVVYGFPPGVTGEVQGKSLDTHPVSKH